MCLLAQVAHFFCYSASKKQGNSYILYIKIRVLVFLDSSIFYFSLSAVNSQVSEPPRGFRFASKNKSKNAESAEES